MYPDTLIKTELPRRTRWRGLLVPAVVGLVAGPMIIVTHETGHYLATGENGVRTGENGVRA